MSPTLESLNFDTLVSSCEGLVQDQSIYVDNALTKDVNTLETTLDKLDDSLAQLRDFVSSPQTTLNLQMPLCENHFRWLETIQNLMLLKSKILLQLQVIDNNQQAGDELDGDVLKESYASEVSQMLVTELFALHEWLKRKCITILSSEKESVDRKNEIQKTLRKFMNVWLRQVTPLIEKANSLVVEREYNIEIPKRLTNFKDENNQSRILVKLKNADEGKSVFLNSEIGKERQLIFKEEPICSQILTDLNENPHYRKIETCHHCMKTIFSEKTINEVSFLKKIISNDATFSNLVRESIPCDHCSGREVYCSPQCKQQAWTHYHNALCCRDKLNDHPMILLERLSFKQQRTTPMLIAKMMAYMFSSFMSSLNSKYGIFVFLSNRDLLQMV